jgi:hypothetical protein
LAVIYGVIGAIAVVAICLDGKTRGAVAAAVLMGAIVVLHAVLAIGARRLNDAAKMGSVIVGVLMLVGVPIGTIIGGLLIYNGVQAWPRKRLQPAATDGTDLRDL